MWNLKINNANELTKQKETHRLREWTYDCSGKGRVREFGKVVYTLLYLKWITKRTYCLVHGTLLNVMWQPGWEWGLGENGHTYGWVPLLFTWNCHNIVNQLCSDTKCMLMYVKSLQSCPTRCDPMDCSPPGSSVHMIFQERILEGVVMPFSRVQNKKFKRKRVSILHSCQQCMSDPISPHPLTSTWCYLLTILVSVW